MDSLSIHLDQVTLPTAFAHTSSDTPLIGRIEGKHLLESSHRLFPVPFSEASLPFTVEAGKLTLSPGLHEPCHSVSVDLILLDDLLEVFDGTGPIFVFQTLKATIVKIVQSILSLRLLQAIGSITISRISFHYPFEIDNGLGPFAHLKSRYALTVQIREAFQTFQFGQSISSIPVIIPFGYDLLESDNGLRQAIAFSGT